MTPPRPRPAAPVGGDAVDPPPVFDCLATARRVWDYVDGELPPDAATAVRTHLGGCADCAGHVAYANAFLAAVATAAGADPAVGSDALLPLRACVRSALRAASADDSRR
jgi:anti-sigma factor RsiW